VTEIDRIIKNEFPLNCSLIGLKCDVEVNECHSNPCMSGGTCMDKVNGFLCLCPPSTHGPLCLSGTDHCALQPCEHGECIEQQYGYVHLILRLRYTHTQRHTNTHTHTQNLAQAVQTGRADTAIALAPKPAAVVNITVWLILNRCWPFFCVKGIVVSVKPAGWDNSVTRKGTSASPVRANMVAPAWTDIMATPACVNLDSEVMMPTILFLALLF